MNWARRDANLQLAWGSGLQSFMTASLATREALVATRTTPT